MISPTTTETINNLFWELSEQQEIANKIPQCIFLSVHDGFPTMFPSVFKSTFESLEKCSSPFSLQNYNSLNFSFKFICLFMSYATFSCLPIYSYNFSVLLFGLIICCIFDGLFTSSLYSPNFFF